MKKRVALFLLFSCASLAFAEEDKSAADIFAAGVNKLMMVLDPGTNAPSTFSARLKAANGAGAGKTLAGREAMLAYQAPYRVLVSAEVDGTRYMIGRNGQQLWGYVPNKNFGAIGKSGLSRFSSAPDKLDHTRMEDLRLPIPREQIALLPMLSKLELLSIRTNETTRVFHIKAQPLPETRQALKLLPFTIEAKIRESDFLPEFLSYDDGRGFTLGVELSDVKIETPWPAEKWELPAKPDDKIEVTALGHLTRFLTPDFPRTL